NDVVSIPPNYPTSTTTPPTHSPTPNSERPTILPVAVRGFVMGERGNRDSAVFRGNAFVSMPYGYRIVPHMK
ncbi:hypothetical protein, partial [Bifidobacterium longum]|uniref:hypothetical protein n=1 Tax=Bifidobacterium longum TaxID=216816 RepID=UPI000C3170C9